MPVSLNKTTTNGNVLWYNKITKLEQTIPFLKQEIVYFLSKANVRVYLKGEQELIIGNISHVLSSVPELNHLIY